MSALLSADDLNDFISPGLACIKPVESLPPPPSQSANGEYEIEIDTHGNTLEVGKDGSKTTLSAAQISLADCLACSGCVTSAEEVLVAQHSHDQLLQALARKDAEGKVFVASVSHQTRSSLAVAYNKSIEQVDRSLIDLFINQMGFSHVVGTSLGRKLSLINEAQNVISKKSSPDGSFKGPVLSSICPGWVLYAEKTHPYVLPRISTVKSAQQITGCLLKTLVSQNHEGTAKSKIYHLSIMPCFDKKLESARKERNEENDAELNGSDAPEEPAAVDVDCVLTAKELVTLIEQSEGRFQLKWDLEGANINQTYASAAPKNWPFVDLAWSNDSGSPSGGYAYNYLEATKRHLISSSTDLSNDNFTVDTIAGRNSDILEIRLVQNNTKVVASAAIVNGFRNIQNLVRKLKPEKPGASGRATGKVNPLVARRRARKEGAAAEKKEGTPSSIESTASSISIAGGGESADASKCDYVEIMACPGGCINGGGQISAGSDVPEKEWISRAIDAYHEIPIIEVENESSILSRWTTTFCNQFGIKEDRLLRTWFQEVEKPTDPNAILLGAKW